jgi:hypothetical protein
VDPSLSVNEVAWSHDGTRILLTVQPRWISFVPSDRISTVPTPLPGLEPYGPAYLPSWNPPLRRSEGDRWLMTASDGKQDKILTYTMSSGKVEPTQVAGGSPSWLPGQKQFAFRDEYKIKLYDFASGQERVLHSTYPNRPQEVRVTRDGSRIYFTQKTREGEIWVGRMGK